jgi:hypothetical protein
MATNAEKGKASLSRMKGHLTRTINQLNKAIAAKDIRTSKINYETAMDKSTRLVKFVEELENVDRIEEA